MAVKSGDVVLGGELLGEAEGFGVEAVGSRGRLGVIAAVEVDLVRFRAVREAVFGQGVGCANLARLAAKIEQGRLDIAFLVEPGGTDGPGRLDSAMLADNLVDPPLEGPANAEVVRVEGCSSWWD